MKTSTTGESMQEAVSRIIWPVVVFVIAFGAVAIAAILR